MRTLSCRITPSFFWLLLTWRPLTLLAQIDASSSRCFGAFWSYWIVTAPSWIMWSLKKGLSVLQGHGKIRKTNFLKKHEKVRRCLLCITILRFINVIYLLFLLQTSNHLLGPKPFPLDRLLAIFYSVVDSRVAPTASIFSQVIDQMMRFGK